MRRMALQGLAIAVCFLTPLMAAEAAKKMRPPLPKPKPIELVTPEPSQVPIPETPTPEIATREPEANEAEPESATFVSGIVIPRAKPAELREPEAQTPVLTAPDLSAPEVESSEPEASEAEPESVTFVSGIVIPRAKPAELREPEAQTPAMTTPDLSAPEIESSEPEASAEVRTAIVIPRAKPAELQKSEPRPEAKAQPRPDAAEGQDDEKPDPGEEFATCRNQLAQLGAKFKVPDLPAAEMSKCTVRNPVQITAITSSTGEVDFPGEPILNCVFAEKFTTWVADIAGPVVRAQTGDTLAAISTGPGYECRGRNGDNSGKISEHAFGNAIDIASFKLKSKALMPVANVAKADNDESRWLMALRISACGYFTTVLGPGANAAHAEHYHFDLGLHGKSGNYKICE